MLTTLLRIGNFYKSTIIDLLGTKNQNRYYIFYERDKKKKMMDQHKKQVHEFWNNRAAFGKNAGTNDFILKELEERVLVQNISPGSHVLDIGCGNGSTLIRLATENQCTGLGLDFAENLLEMANLKASETKLTNRLEFRKGNVLEIGSDLGCFDNIITQRCLINLENQKEQEMAFGLIVDRLRPGGFYYMVEAFNDGNRQLNHLREKFQLEPMTSPWHNCFFELSDVIKWKELFPIELITVSNFASTYYFLSRVIYAKLASDHGEELHYDSEINLISLDLPAFGEFGATKLIIWKRK